MSICGVVASTLSDLSAIGLAWARFAPALAIVPAFGLRALPVPARAILGIALAAGIHPALVPVVLERPATPWFVLALVPVSHLFPIGASYAERFLYIPSLGACVAIAALLRRIRARRVGACAFALLVLIGAGMTLRRNQDWRDEERFYLSSIDSSPRNPTLRNNLGRYYADHGKLDLAEEHFAEAIRLKADHPPALCNLGVIRAMEGRLAEAQDLIERSIAADPGYARGYCNLGKVHALHGRIDEARAAFERALALNPGYADARQELERLR